MLGSKYAWSATTSYPTHRCIPQNQTPTRAILVPGVLESVRVLERNGFLSPHGPQSTQYIN